MKPLSKRQREVLHRMEKGSYIWFIEDADLCRMYPDKINIHLAVFKSLLETGCIKKKWGWYHYIITPSGLTALAKPTRNRGKKKKPDLGVCVHQIITI